MSINNEENSTATTSSGTGSSTNVDLHALKYQVLLEFFSLTYKPKFARTRENSLILKHVGGKFEPGKLSAILGPSGAGKTSLLNVLSGFKTKGVTGDIFVNGERMDNGHFRSLSSYIPQNFTVLPMLTVRETLQVSTSLKLGRKISKAIKLKVIRDILDTLNLNKCADNLVGHLSGGELKRLSIAVELVSNHPIMFIDEPTSGLDSVSSTQLVHHLRELAQDGRNIICVIHQPSSKLLEFFDDIYLLSDGECVYNGPLDYMVKHFAEAGFTCPQYYNRADFVLEIASKEQRDGDLNSLIIRNRLKNSSLLSEIITPTNETTNLLYRESSTSNRSIDKIMRRHRKYRISCFEQFWVLTKRSLLATFRDFMCVQLRILAHILVAGLLGIVFWNIGADAAKILSNNSCLFFFLMFIFFANSMPTVLTFPIETAVFLREHLNSWYSIGAYYMSKFASDLPVQLICPTIFISIAYFLTGQPHDVGRFSMLWGILVLTSVLSQSLGLVAGAAFDMQLGVFLVPASCIPMLIFSGFFIRYNELFAWLRPLTHVSYFRYSFEGSIQAIYGYNRTLTCSEPFCYYKSAEKFLRDMNMDGDRYGGDILGLCVWIVILQILLYISLIVRVRQAQ